MIFSLFTITSCTLLYVGYFVHSMPTFVHSMPTFVHCMTTTVIKCILTWSWFLVGLFVPVAGRTVCGARRAQSRFENVEKAARNDG